MLPSLKGVFPQPKVQHKRNFLRENKLHLKELQRISNRQQLQQAEEEQKLVALQRRQRHKSLDNRQFFSRRAPSTECSCDCMKPMVCCRTESASTEARKVETCNREVQTDDILDEDFLYKALKRYQNSENGRERGTSYIPEDKHLSSAKADNHYDTNEQNFHFENLAIDSERNQPACNSTQRDSTKRSMRRVHELGDRQDIRLPKYLEREKRDKELKKQKEQHRDRNCPLGYEPLSEEERQTALNTAQRKFKDLVSELNHMPMTTETLRIRNRKVEIEHELGELENDIRIFSKSKVYVKASGIC